MRFDENPFTRWCQKENNAYGFQIWHFYWSFSSDIIAVKGLTKRKNNDGHTVTQKESNSLSKANLTPSLPQPVKCPGRKIHGHACKQFIFRSCNTLSMLCGFMTLFKCQSEKKKKKKGGGGGGMLKGLSSALLLIVFKRHHGSKRVKHDRVRAPHGQVNYTAAAPTVLHSQTMCSR